MIIRLPLQVSSHLFCVGLLAFVTITASAQVPQEITFQDAVRIALDQNTQLRQSTNQLRFSEIDVRFARAAYLPSFNVSTGGGTNFGLSFDTNVGELRTTANSRFNISAGTSVTLFDGFQRRRIFVRVDST